MPNGSARARASSDCAPCRGATLIRTMPSSRALLSSLDTVEREVPRARAVASLPLLLELALPLVRPGGFLCAYKGPALSEELPAAKRALKLLNGAPREPVFLPIPGRDWDHRLLIVDKLSPTPAAYPRKAGEPEKKPL